MKKLKCLQTILLSFLILGDSSTHPLENLKMCSPYKTVRDVQSPHIVFIKTHSNGKVLCQGTLIDVNWVLTSAPCINNITNKISLYDVDFSFGNKTQEIIRKTKKVVVENNHSIALIKLNKPITISSTIAPIKLATRDLSKNMKCLISSFQKYSNNELTHEYWNILFNISKQIHNKNEWYFEDTICREKIWSLLHMTDDGTPLICDNYLYGVYSTNSPKVFNSVFNYKKWILREINFSTSNKNTGDAKTNVLFKNKLHSTDLNDVVTEHTDNPTTQDANEVPTYSTQIIRPLATTFTQQINNHTTNPIQLNFADIVTEETNSSPTTSMDVTKEMEETEDENILDYSSTSNLFTDSSVTEESTASPEPSTDSFDFTEETEDFFTEQPSSDTPFTQSSSTEGSTASPEPSTDSFDFTEETEDFFTEQPNSDTPFTQSSSTEGSTASPEPSTDSFDFTEETEDFFTEQPSSDTTFTQSSSTEGSTVSPQIPTDSFEETDETEEPFTEQTGPYTTITDDIEETLETEDSTPIYVNTPFPTVDIISSTITTTISTKVTDQSTSSTTPFIDPESKTTLSPPTGSTEITYKTSTALIDNDSSSSQIVMFNKTLIAVLCVFIYLLFQNNLT